MHQVYRGAISVEETKAINWPEARLDYKSYGTPSHADWSAYAWFRAEGSGFKYKAGGVELEPLTMVRTLTYEEHKDVTNLIATIGGLWAIVTLVFSILYRELPSKAGSSVKEVAFRFADAVDAPANGDAPGSADEAAAVGPSAAGSSGAQRGNTKATELV